MYVCALCHGEELKSDDEVVAAAKQIEVTTKDPLPANTWTAAHGLSFTRVTGRATVAGGRRARGQMSEIASG